MTRKKKVTVITLVSILTVCVFAFLGFTAFVSSIRNQRTCEWANIDNIELHAHIDVPKVTQWDCSYDKENNIKKASFTIDRNNFDLINYIQSHNLQRLNSVTELIYDKFLNMEKEPLTSSDFYYKKSPPGGELYEVLLDKNTGRLWVTIKYND